MNPYETLGLSQSATKAEVKAAYRKAAQRAHPDREGGDAERFHQVSVAFEVLYDDERRARYDATGQIDEQARSVASEAEQCLTEVFSKIIDSGYDGDILAKARRYVTSAREHGEAERAGGHKKLTDLENLSGRVVADGEDNLFQIALESKIDRLKQALDAAEASLATMEEAERLLDQYEDTSPPEAGPASRPAFNVGMFGGLGAHGFSGA